MLKYLWFSLIFWPLNVVFLYVFLPWLQRNLPRWRIRLEDRLVAKIMARRFAERLREMRVFTGYDTDRLRKFAKEHGLEIEERGPFPRGVEVKRKWSSHE